MAEPWIICSSYTRSNRSTHTHTIARLFIQIVELAKIKLRTTADRVGFDSLRKVVVFGPLMSLHHNEIKQMPSEICRVLVFVTGVEKNVDSWYEAYTKRSRQWTKNRGRKRELSGIEKRRARPPASQLVCLERWSSFAVIMISETESIFDDRTNTSWGNTIAAIHLRASNAFSFDEQFDRVRHVRSHFRCVCIEQNWFRLCISFGLCVPTIYSSTARWAGIRLTCNGQSAVMSPK